MIEVKRGIIQEKTQPQNGIEWKPRRTQFCSICRHAISYLGPSLSFTGNCIGLRNYSNFFLGLCYGVLGGLYAVVITWPFFYNCIILGSFSEELYKDVYYQQYKCEQVGANSYIFVPTLIGFWLAFCMMLLHIMLLLADISTYDLLTYWDKYPMMNFMLQRIQAKKFLDRESRLRILIFKRRKGLLWYLVPVRNSELLI